MKAYAQRHLPELSFLCVVLMFSSVHLSAYALTESDYTYEVTDSTATITGFNTAYSGALIIANTLGGFPVTGICADAFYDCGGLTNVIIPDSVTGVGDFAFGQCVGLTNVIVGNRVADIGEGAFANCHGLSSLIIPDSVTNIGRAAFGATGITAISLPYGITRIEDDLFGHCENLRSVTIPDSVTSIGNYAFSSCDIRSIVIPASVTSIGDRAFQYNTALTDVYFKGNAPAIGSGVFWGFPAATVYYLPGATGWGATFGGRPAVPWVMREPYEYSVDAGKVTISKYLGSGGAVTVPSTIMGEPVSVIGAYAFQSCTGLSRIALPSSVIRVDEHAFHSCSNLTGVYFQGDAPSTGTDIFSGADKVTVYYVLGTAGWAATFGDRPAVPLSFNYSVSDSAVTITGYTGPGGYLFIPSTLAGMPVTSIGYEAFPKCDGLTGITIPAGVTNIDDYAMNACYYLTDVVLSEGLIRIGRGAFNSCSRLTRITIPPHVTSIGPEAFCGCESLVSVTIPSGVSRIEVMAFNACRSLISVTIPSGVTSIGARAFDGCDGLDSLYFEGDAPSLDPDVFGGDSRATVFYVFGAAGWGSSFGGCLTAVWTSMASFDAGGGSAEFASRAYNVYNAYGRLPTASLPEYDFDGWWTGAGGTGALVTEDTRVTDVTNHTIYAKWMMKVNQPPLIMRRAPLADPAAVTEGSSVAFSVAAGDSTDPIMESRGMSNITWYVDGVLKQETRAGAPNAITSAFTWKTDTNTVQGMVYKEFVVKVVAMDRTRGMTETNWSVRVNNVPAAQTIAFKPLPVMALGTTNFNPGATVSSGLPVAYSNSNPAVAQIVDGLIRITGAGTTVITASQPGNFDFKAATSVKQTLTVKARLTTEVPSGGGTVTGAGLYLPGAKVALTAKPGTGNTFLHWEDGSQATARSLVMPNANTTVQAWFGITTNVPKPVIADPGAQRAMVGVHFRLPLDIASESLPTVTVTGLPAGLAYVTATKAITGVPTAAASNKTVTVTAKNVNKTSVTRTFAMTVEPLPAWASGAFNGAAGTDALGSGSASLSVTALGAATGKLTLRGTNFIFSAKSYAGRGGDGSFTLVTTAAVGKVAWPLTLSLIAPVCADTNGVTPPTLSKAEGTLNADGWIALYRNVWKDIGMAAVLTNNWAGYYTAVLPGGPECGSGYLTFTVDKLGGVKTVGKLADGTAVSLSGTLILDGAGSAWTVLYSAPAAYKGGGVFGVAEFVRPGEGAKVVVRLLDGDDFVWENLSPGATQSYGRGFLRRLDLCGGWYDTVGNLYRYYGSGVLQSVTDARAAAPEILVGTNRYDAACWEPDGLVLTAVTNRSGIMTGLSALKAWTPVKAGGGNAYDYTSGTNAVGLTVGLNRPTGVFKGTFKAWFDYASTHTSKLISYEGVLTPEHEAAEDGVAGRGFFVWPDTSAYLSPLGKPVSYGFSWSYDFKILLSNPVRLFLTATDNGREVSLSAGSVLQVVLAGNPSTGFSWQVDAYDPAVLTKVSEAYEQDRGHPFASGVGGVYTFRFYAESAGVSPLRLVYRGPPGAPEDTFEVQATVR